MRPFGFSKRLGQLLAVLLALVLGTGMAHAQASPPATQSARAADCIDWLRGHLWLQEMGANNRAPLIDAWARQAGVDLGSEWCGLTQMQCQLANHLPIPAGPAGSYNWFRPASPRTVYLQGRRGTYATPVPGYPAGIFNARLGRVAHITRIVQVVPGPRPGGPPRGYWCIAGNEGRFPGRVRLTFYPYAAIYAAANWLY